MELVSMVRACAICGTQERLVPIYGKPTYGAWRPAATADAAKASGPLGEWVRRNLPRAVKAHPAGEAGVLAEAHTGARNLRLCMEPGPYDCPPYAKVAAVMERVLGVAPDLRPGRWGRSVEAHDHRFVVVPVAPAAREAAGVQEYAIVREK